MTRAMLVLAMVTGCATDFEIPEDAIRIDPEADCTDFTGGRLNDGAWELGPRPFSDMLVTIPVGSRFDGFGFRVDGRPGDVLSVRVNTFAVPGEVGFPLIVDQVPATNGWTIVPLPANHADTIFVLPESAAGTVRISDMFVTVSDE